MKANLLFPIPKISKRLKYGNVAQRVSIKSPVYLAAVLEYLTAEVLELAGDAAKTNLKLRISPSHIQHAIKNDAELEQLIANGTFVNAAKAIEQGKPKTTVKKEEK